MKHPHTFEGTPKPSMDWVVQTLHLRNRRHLRFNELPVLGSFLLDRCFRGFVRLGEQALEQ